MPLGDHLVELRHDEREQGIRDVTLLREGVHHVAVVGGDLALGQEIKIGFLHRRVVELDGQDNDDQRGVPGGVREEDQRSVVHALGQLHVRCGLGNSLNAQSAIVAGDDENERLVKIIDRFRAERVALVEEADPSHPVFNLRVLVGICALSGEFARMAEV